MSKTVMIIDDSELFRRIIRVYLKNRGFEILESTDGREALNQLDGRQVHLFICDVNMPVMDGLTFVRKIKGMAEYKFTPVIMLTTESQEEKKKQGIAAGVKVWMVKPFTPEELSAAIDRLLV